MLRKKRLQRAIRRRILGLALFNIIASECEYAGESTPRSVWVKQVNLRRHEHEQGFHHNLFLELSIEDPARYRRCLRLGTDTFEQLTSAIAPLIERQNTQFRQSISVGERLSLTLRHLATGESQQALSDCFRIAQSTISGIVHEVCGALLAVLKDKYLQVPSSEAEWKAVAHDFYDRWNFPNCIGAMDGKHFLIIPPFQSGSYYYNYKGTFSVVLLAVVDAHLRFIYVDAGTNGRISDSGIWNKSSLKQKLETNDLNIPSPSCPPNGNKQFPYIIVGDEGFPLTEQLMIPYPGALCSGRRDRRIYNYRHSRARRCSENAFGVLCGRFEIFRSPMRYDPDKATTIVLACCALHNMLRSQVVGAAMYTPSGSLDEEDIMSGIVRPGDWRNASAPGGVRPLVHQGGNRHRNAALQLRNDFCEYFNGAGAVSWQDGMIS